MDACIIVPISLPHDAGGRWQMLQRTNVTIWWAGWGDNRAGDNRQLTRGRGSICQSCRLNWPYPFSYCPKGQTSCFHHGKCHPKQHSTQIFFEIQSNPSNMRGSVRDDQEPSGLVLHTLTRAIEFLFCRVFFRFCFLMVIVVYWKTKAFLACFLFTRRGGRVRIISERTARPISVVVTPSFQEGYRVTVVFISAVSSLRHDVLYVAVSRQSLMIIIIVSILLYPTLVSFL